MGAFDEKPIRALAVDLANLSIRTDAPVLMGSNARQPLLLRDVIDIMNDLYGFEFNIPIFFIIDARVVPYNMTRPETEDLWRMESAEPHDLERVWRIRKQRFGISRREDDKSRFKETADAALCELANKRNVAVVSGDRFFSESQSGKLQRPLDLIRFRPHRESRSEGFTFYNESMEYGGRPLPQLVADLTNDEYWDEWAECAQILSGHMDRDQKKHDRSVISTWLKNRVRDSARSTSLSPTPAGPPEIPSGHRPDQSVSTAATENLPAPRTDHLPPEESVPVEVVPAPPLRAERLVPEAVFVFRDLRDLRAHQGMTVEMVSRPFRVGEQLFFKLYAAGMGVLVELADDQDIKTGHQFISATGLLELADHGWVLRNASINGVVPSEDVEELKPLGRRVELPTFTQWGRLPTWLRRRQQVVQQVDEHPPGPDQGTDADLPVVHASPEPLGTGTSEAQIPTDSATSPEPQPTPIDPPKAPTGTVPEKTGTPSPAPTVPTGTDCSGQAEPTADETDSPVPDGEPDDETESPEPVPGPGDNEEPEVETEPREHRRLVMAGVAVGACLALVIPFRIFNSGGAGESPAAPAGTPSSSGDSRVLHTR